MRRRHLVPLAAAAGLLAGIAVAAQPASAATAGCDTYTYVRTGNISAGRTDQPFAYFFTIRDPGPVELCLDGPEGADVDLVLTRLGPGGATPVATAPSGGADKTLTYTGPITAYRALVVGNSGGGAYTLGLNLP
jgi:hypothetical protein